MAPQVNNRGTSNRGTGRNTLQEAPRRVNAAALGLPADPALDAQMAALATISSVTTALQVGRLTGDEIGALLLHVRHAAQRFGSAPGPLTQQAIAGDLLEAYRVLRDRERVARRGPKGELLKEVRGINGTISLAPWAPSRPKRVEDILLADSLRPLFGPENVRWWLSAVSYRTVAAQPPGGARRRALPPPRPSQPVDSAGVHAYNLTIVEGRGKMARRRTLPWPLPDLLIPHAYKIDLVKSEGMSFLTREGRTKILAFILEVVAETGEDGSVYSEETGEWIAPERLAAFIVETAEVGIGRIMFEGPESEFRSFERAQIGYRTGFIITNDLIQILWHYTKIQEKFRQHGRKEPAKGCASIEWITELLKEVPHRYKQLWVQDRLVEDQVVYPDKVYGQILKPGMIVPAGYFLTEKVAESLGGEDHQVLFITSFTANDRVILTEDGRVWLVKERERNLQAFCEAVIQLQGILTLSFVFASAIGAVLGGPLVSFLITAGDVAIDINQAGGIRHFLKELKNNPLKAGWFMLDLATAVGDVKGMRQLLMNPTESLEASMRVANEAAQAKRALPSEAGQPVTTATKKGSRVADGAKATEDDARLAKESAATQTPHDPSTSTKANTHLPDRPTTGRPARDTRATTRPTEPPRTPQETPPRGKGEPDVEVTVTESVEDAAKSAKAADAAETVRGTGRRQAPSRDRKRGPFGTVKDVRHRRPPKSTKTARGGTRRNPPGVRSIRGGGRMKKAAAAVKDPMSVFLGKGKQAREAAERLERLNAGDLLREIASEWAERAPDGRKVLARIAKMTDDEVQGLAAVHRVLIDDEITLKAPRRLGPHESQGTRVLRGATSGKDWWDVFHLPSGARSDLLKLVGKLEPVVDSGLGRALRRTLETGAYSLQGGLGHFHAAAHLADEYRSRGIRMIMEELVYVARVGLREIDIHAIIGGVLHMDIEVKTYLRQLVMYGGVRRQIAKDLLRHVDDGFEGMQYLFSPNVKRQLQLFCDGILEVFDGRVVQEALRAEGLDAARVRAVLVRRLEDTGHPMVDVYRYR